jgi:hypothetical protein
MNSTSDPIVVVTGMHGVAVVPVLAAQADEKGWLGIFPGEAELLVQHIQQSVKLAYALNAYWVPSGGITRIGASISEAESAFNLAEAAGWWGFSEVKARTLIEDYALDSLQNIAFSLAVIRKATGHYPRKCLCLGFSFKRERYISHAQGLGYSGEFVYLGINDPNPDLRYRAIVGEHLKMRSAKHDRLLQGPEWRAQRKKRDICSRGLPDYTAVDPALAPFFAYAWGDGPWAPPPNW